MTALFCAYDSGPALAGRIASKQANGSDTQKCPLAARGSIERINTFAGAAVLGTRNRTSDGALTSHLRIEHEPETTSSRLEQRNDPMC